FFNLRVLIGLFVVLAGVLLALFGLGAFSSAFAQGKGTTTSQASPGTQAPDVVQMVGPVRVDQYLRTLPSVPPKPEFEERVLTGPITYNTLFAPLTGTPCSGQNDGDPFVFYDHLADRWVISDFAFPGLPGSGPFYQCIAVSQGPNPVTDGWFLYALQHEPAHP